MVEVPYLQSYREGLTLRRFEAEGDAKHEAGAPREGHYRQGAGGGASPES